MPSILCGLKKIPERDLRYVYVQFLGNRAQKIDLDIELLRELVELYLEIQFTRWPEINRTAQLKFPNITPFSVIEQIERQFECDAEGFITLFGEYMPYYILLKHFQVFERTQKKPHLKPRDPRADHLAIIKHMKHKGCAYKLIYTEVKTTRKNARRRVKDEIFAEFGDIENGLLDRDIIDEVKALDLDFFENRKQAKELAESLFWKGNIHFQALVVSANCDYSSFKGYDEFVPGERKTIKRRWAVVIPIEDWDNWVVTVRNLVKTRIQEIKAEGKV